jgi:GDPmannose 4,6-dehydratase
MPKKIALTGTTGQDAVYLIEYLLENEPDVEIHGMVRRSSTWNTQRIDHLMNNKEIFNKRFFTHYGDITDSHSVNDFVNTVKPYKFFNLAAQSHVAISFEIPAYTLSVDGAGTLNVLHSVKNIVPECKVFQASTSELCGGLDYNMPVTGYDENTRWHPRSPYSAAKLYAYWITRNYRESYNTFACNGITFNHSSKWRGENFLTRKVTIWAGRNYNALKNGKDVTPLALGNIASKRDESHSYDVVRAMNLILNQEKADDYVVGAGETHSIKEWVEQCFKWMEVPLEWQGEGINEVGISNGKIVVKIDPKYFRPAEVPVLLSNPAKIKALGWKPKYTYEMIVDDMMKADLERFGK